MERSRVTIDITLPREPKQERSRRKQETLIQAAEELFSTLGYENVTADEIAAHAGHGTGTFYNYFTNKTQVFLMVAGRHETAVVPTMGSIQQAMSAGADLHDLAVQIVRTIVDERQKVPWLRRTWLRLALTDEDVEQVQQQLDEEWDAALARLVEATTSSGRMARRSAGARPLGSAIRILVDAIADEVVLRGVLSADDAAMAAADMIAGLLTED